VNERSKGDRGWWLRTVAPQASGIFRRRTEFLRRSQALRRPPKLPRPTVSASLLLLLFGVAVAGAAFAHRRSLDARFEAQVVRGRTAPFDVQRIRRDLAALDLDEKALARELEARLSAAAQQAASDFYLVLDTRTKTLTLRFGDRIVREAPLAVGPPRFLRAASGERVTAPPLTGAFTVRQKLERPAWKAPASAYIQAGRPVPDPLPEIRGGLGRYVVVLAEDVVLHSPPPVESPLHGPRPGSFEAPEADLAAIWKRIGPETRVYVF
jgi:hypothetical protein